MAENYEPYIFNALNTAKVMIVYGKNPDYFNAVWTRNEWSRFQGNIKAGKKQPNSLIVAYEGLDPYTLPEELRNLQCVNAAEKTFYHDLENHISKVIGESKASADQAKPAKKSKKGGIIAAIGVVLAVALVVVLGSVFGLFNGGGGGGGGGGDEGGDDTVFNPTGTDYYIQLSGDGDSYVFNGVTDDMRETITNYVIPATYNNVPISSIENNAFKNSGIVTVTLPATIVAIGPQAFANCENLTTVIFSEGTDDEDVCLTTIGEGAFSDCPALESFVIPSSVTSIGANAFYNCESLIEIVYANNSELTSISEGAFESCTHLMYFVPASELETGEKVLKIPSSLMSIGVNAFHECAFEYIEYQDNAVLGDIGNNAFASCTSLYEVKLPVSVSQIGTGVFQNCSSLRKLVTPVMGSNSASSGYLAYLFGALSYTDANYVPSTLITVEITKALASLSTYAFYNCSSVVSVTLSPAILSIDNYAFSGCTSLESVSFGTNSILSSIGQEAFKGCTSLETISFPNALATIGTGAFSGCTELSPITFPSSLTTIGNTAFMGCSSLTTVTVPSTVTSIGDGAFAGCTSLTSITLPFVGSSLESTGMNGYFGSIFSQSTISNSNVVQSLKTVTITGGTSMVSGAFSDCENLTTINLPSTLSAIGDSTFAGCEDLISISINANVSSIGESAFLDCSSLTSVNFVGSVNALALIDEEAFKNCTQLTTITFPNTLDTISQGAFSGCTALSSVVLPSSLKTIESSAFSGCTDLESITIPSNVISIGGGAFSGCTALSSISLPFVGTATNATGASACFGYIFSAVQSPNATLHEALKIVTITNCSTIKDNAFSGCQYLTSINLPVNLSSIGNSAFTNCTELTSFTIPSGVTSIGTSVLSGCTKLESVSIPFLGAAPTDTTSQFGYLFGGYNSSCPATLTTVTLTAENSIQSPGFSSCANIVSIIITDTCNLTTIIKCHLLLKWKRTQSFIILYMLFSRY